MQQEASQLQLPHGAFRNKKNDGILLQFGPGESNERGAFRLNGRENDSKLAGLQIIL